MIRAYGNHIIIKRDELEQPQDHTVKSGYIILPDVVLARSRHAMVMSVGGWVKETLLAGDKVYVTWRVAPIYNDDIYGDVEVLHEDEVLAVIT